MFLSDLHINTFITISRQASVVYDVERVFINLNYMINNILRMFLLIPVQILYQHNTFRQAMLFSILSLVVGHWLRLLINVNYYLVYLGQVILSVANAMINLGAWKYIDSWFETEKRALAYSLAMII